MLVILKQQDSIKGQWLGGWGLFLTLETHPRLAVIEPVFAVCITQEVTATTTLTSGRVVLLCFGQYLRRVHRVYRPSAPPPSLMAC